MGYGLTKTQLDSAVNRRKADFDIRYIPSPQTSRFLAVGYNNALADFFWIESLNYYGSVLTNKQSTKDYKYMDAYLQTILHLDPLFVMFYDWAATVFIYNGNPVSRDNVAQSIEYANLGIINLNRVLRYNDVILSKAAFNYALEAHDFTNSIPYFEFAGRVSNENRHLLLVGSTYALYANEEQRSTDLKLEFLSHLVFEAKKKSDLMYAIGTVTASTFNREAQNFIRSFRLGMEKDEDVRKLVESKFADSPLYTKAANLSENLHLDTRLKKIMQVDISRNWLDPTLHLLLSL